MLHWVCKTHLRVKLFDVHARLNKVIFLMQHALK